MSLDLWTRIAWATLIAAPFVTGALCYHIGRHHERTEGKHRRTADRLDEQWDEWQATMTAAYTGPVIRAKTGPLPVGDDTMWDLPGGLRPVRSRRPPDHITAADLAPVVVPPPELTDTGELRAIRERGEAIRAAMLTSELAWRTKAGQP